MSNNANDGVMYHGIKIRKALYDLGDECETIYNIV
jgi:hypothetical protein